jgi:hypothetical protein
VLEYFRDILMDNGRTFPKSDVSCDPRTSRELLFGDFRTRLMRWWNTGRMGFTEGGYPKVVQGALLLPVDVKSKKELYKKLVVATFNIQTPGCLYGGR